MKLQRCCILLLILALPAGCAGPQIPAVETAPVVEPAPVAEAAETPVTVTDMTGREVRLDSPATRIVALSPADCEILYAIGAEGALVGRGEYCDYPAEVGAVPSVQSGYETNLEQVVALAPQVLLMTKMGQTVEQVAALEAAGIRVAVSDAQDIAGVYDAIALLGALTGREEAATALADGMLADLSAIAEGTAGVGTETVYFEVSPLEYGLWTAGADTFMNEIAALLGLQNAFPDVSGWGEVSEEQVIERNPDYIVTIAMYFGEGPTPVEEILARPGWQDVTAVKNGAVLNLQNNELSRPGPRLVDGARLLSDFVGAARAQDHAA